MKKSDCSVQCHLNGFNCAQAVLSTYCGELGLDTETALRIAGAFDGGMGRIGETCGAVTGAIMLIGLKYGKVKPDDDAAREKSYALAQEFARRFKAEHGTLRCNELLGFDIGKPEEMQKARENQLFSTVCNKLIRDSSEIVEELLDL
jgi:C_GCAxxG_C_C family probable redox protein